MALVDHVVVFVADLLAEFVDFRHNTGRIVLFCGNWSRKDVLIFDFSTKETSDHTLSVILSCPTSIIKNSLSINFWWSLLKNSLVCEPESAVIELSPFVIVALAPISDSNVMIKSKNNSAKLFV